MGRYTLIVLLVALTQCLFGECHHLAEEIILEFAEESGIKLSPEIQWGRPEMLLNMEPENNVPPNIVQQQVDDKTNGEDIQPIKILNSKRMWKTVPQFLKKQTTGQPTQQPNPVLSTLVALSNVTEKTNVLNSAKPSSLVNNARPLSVVNNNKPTALNNNKRPTISPNNTQPIKPENNQLNPFGNNTKPVALVQSIKPNTPVTTNPNPLVSNSSPLVPANSSKPIETADNKNQPALPISDAPAVSSNNTTETTTPDSILQPILSNITQPAIAEASNDSNTTYPLELIFPPNVTLGLLPEIIKWGTTEEPMFAPEQTPEPAPMPMGQPEYEVLPLDKPTSSPYTTIMPIYDLEVDYVPEPGDRLPEDPAPIPNQQWQQHNQQQPNQQQYNQHQPAQQHHNQHQVGPKVRLSHGGVLEGTMMRSTVGKMILAFRGIPYAVPPIGQLRFREPRPATPWFGERQAKWDGPACAQAALFKPHRQTIIGNEDCLYLNVYVPYSEVYSGDLPVMVYFHGGAYHFGSSHSILFGPERLLNFDVILVTSNYRLGPFGFLSTGTLDCPGNNGLKDQVEVLKWVKNNIISFGGNPNNVTIFGQSAGAASVAHHLTSPKTAGLFQKAIMQSGTNFDCWAVVQNRTALYRARKLRSLLCNTNEENWALTMDCFRFKTTEEIINAVSTFYSFGVIPITAFGPVVELEHQGAYMTLDPRDVSRPHGITIPVMVGVTADEGVLQSGPILNLFDLEFKIKFEKVLPKFLYYEDRPKLVRKAITAKVNRFYFKDIQLWSRENHQDLTNLFSDRLFFSGMDQYLRNRFEQRNSTIGTTFVYLFDHKGPMTMSRVYGSGPEYYGVVHGDELPYLFPMNGTHIPSVDNDGRMKWALPRMWTNFAISGNPTPIGSGIRAWRSAKQFKLNYAQIGSKNTTDKTVLRNHVGFLDARTRFWRKIQTEFLN